MRALVLSMMVSPALAGGLPDIDRDHLPNGMAHFVLIQGEEEMGEMRYSFLVEDDRIVIHDGTTMRPNIRESGTAVLEKDTFAPRSLVMDADFARNILDADLTWEDGTVSGEYHRKGPDDAEKTLVPFSQDAPKDAILRWSVFGLIPALPLEDGDAYDLTWFAPLAGSHAPVTLRVDGTARVETPDGTYDTIKVAVDATPANVVYVATTTPRKVVRIDVPAQDMRFELLPMATDTE